MGHPEKIFYLYLRLCFCVYCFLLFFSLMHGRKYLTNIGFDSHLLHCRMRWGFQFPKLHSELNLTIKSGSDSTNGFKKIEFTLL